MSEGSEPRVPGDADEMTTAHPGSRPDSLPLRLLPPLQPRPDRMTLRRQLYWMVAIRLVIITSMVVLYALLTLLPRQTLTDLDPSYLLSLAASIYAASVLYILLLQLGRLELVLQAYTQFAGDLLVITALVYYSGGLGSPFSMLYLVVISVAAVLLRRRAAVFVASIAYLLYAGTAFALHTGWLEAPNALAEESVTLGRLIYNLVMHLFGFYAVAFLTSYLARTVTQTERQLAEKQENLADLQVVYQDVVQSISSGLVTTDLDGTVTSINRVGEQILRTSAERLIGSHISTSGLFSWEEWSQQTVHQRSRSEVEFVPAEGADGDGETVVIGYSLTPLTDAHGARKGYILVFQDLTEWRELQAELRMKDRMVAVGELAAGLAHEIGNPLASISGSVQMLKPQTGEESQEHRLLEIVLRESQRLDRTIKSFLQFARPKERTTARFDIGALLAEHVELLRNSSELRDDHEITLDAHSRTVIVDADPDQVSQILWNLSRNALRAMPDGGELTVRGEVSGRDYHLEVADTGIGMSPEEQTRLFHPFKSFFDEGTGIGMAIVYRIVEEHGGRLTVDSAPGVGTEITAELPIVAEVRERRPSYEETGS